MPQYRQERNYENLNKIMFDGAGAYGVPVLAPVQCSVDSWISFNFAKTCRDPENYGIHFFIDDYQFTRLWSQPDAYTAMLSKYRAVMTPDYSLYTDFPKAIQIYNHYRKHWLGAYWQKRGLTVVPTVGWSDEDSLNWCFDGEPVGGTVAVSAVGTQMDNRARYLFDMGYKAMLEKLQPETIIFYGAIPEGLDTGNVIRIAAYQDKLKKFNKTIENVDKSQQRLYN